MADRNEPRKPRRSGPQKEGPRGRPKGTKPAQPAKPSRALQPLLSRAKLDLSLPPEEPLDAEELRDVERHLAFLRRFKSHLRLSLNAQEDLWVNGARQPEDRGALKHLLRKVDRAALEQALGREPLKAQTTLRAAFLAGAVRLLPEVSILAAYLETVAQISERREAAQALALTIDRIDFRSLSAAQLTLLVDTVWRTFTGPDQLQAALGLVSSQSFAEALERDGGALTPEIQALLFPLLEARRVVLGGATLPEEDAAHERVARGIERWLDAPREVIRSYPLEVRLSLADYVFRSDSPHLPLGLLDQLPKADPRAAKLSLAWAERLMSSGEESRARTMVRELAINHPDLERARLLAEVLSWKQVGRLMLHPEHEKQAEALRGLRRAFWLDGGVMGWARIGPPEKAGDLAAEARLQGDVLLPGVAPALAHGLGKDGTAFIFVAATGQPFLELRGLSLSDALAVAQEAVTTLRALAAAGIELPDVGPERFFWDRRLTLANLADARATDPARAALAQAQWGRLLVRRLLSVEPGAARSPWRPDLPLALAAQLRPALPIPVLVKLLAKARLALRKS